MIYLYRIRYLNDFIKTYSRINSNHSEKREEVENSDHVSAALLLAWLYLSNEQFAMLQLHQATVSLQMQLHGQTWTWAGRSSLPGRRRKAGQGATWKKALLLL